MAAGFKITGQISVSHISEPRSYADKEVGDAMEERQKVARKTVSGIYRRPLRTSHTQHQPIRYWVQREHAMLPALAAKQRILDMIRGATRARLLLEQPLLARLSALIESATAACFDALDDSEKQANGPTVTNPTVPEQDDDDDFEPTFVSVHSSKRSSPGCLTEPDCDA